MMKKVLFLALIGIALWSVEAARIDDYGDVLSEDELPEYLAHFPGNLLDKRGGRPRRGFYCLKRDMTCPDLGKKDFCCRGSQCSCNLFGQNCKCSTIGLFQRLG